jgi:large subunit ribosomal protein L21
MPYAVIMNGGKQHRVREGDIVRSEKINTKIGEDIEFSSVFMLVDDKNIRIGTPFLDGVKVTAKVLTHDRDKKVNILKFKRRKDHMKRAGHRQWFTEVKITGIEK